MSFFSMIIRSLAPRRKKRRKRRAGTVQGGGMRPSSGADLPKVVVTSLFGSGGNEVADRLSGMISSETALTAIRLNKTVKQNLRLGLLERLLTASDEAATLLKDESGDLLIWGEMEDMGTVARLHFQTAVPAPDGSPGTFGLADTLDLSIPWPDDCGDLVRSIVLAVAMTQARGSRKTMNERLLNSLEKAEKVAEKFTNETPAEYRASIFTAMGNAYATAYRFGTKKALSGALQNYEKSDALISSESEPLIWALVQTHWGIVMEADARVRKDPEALQAAVARYKGVSDTLARDSHAYDWALANMRRAMALYKLATMAPEKTATFLKDAAAAFEAALEVYDRTTMPLRWAEVMNNYGVAQMALGGYGAGNHVLQQAISTFRKALEVRKRESYPELWAQTANNLGAACVALAKRTREEHLLEEAVTNFRGAKEIYQTMPGNEKRVVVIEKNLDRVQGMLAKMAD